jgi:hypothetical protein
MIFEIIYIILIIVFTIFWIYQLVDQFKEKKIWWFVLTLLFPILAIVYALTKLG